MEIVSYPEFYNYVAEKSVAIVGSSKAQLNRWDGKKIDSHDLVVRMNWGLIYQKGTQGSRTDILYVGCLLPSHVINEFCPSYIMCTQHRLSRIKGDHKVWPIPEEWRTELNEKFAPDRPSTGFRVLNFFLFWTGAEDISLFGFDSFRSGTYYNDRELFCPRHNPEKERKIIQGYIDQGMITAHGW